MSSCERKFNKYKVRLNQNNLVWIKSNWLNSNTVIITSKGSLSLQIIKIQINSKSEKVPWGKVQIVKRAINKY